MGVIEDLRERGINAVTSEQCPEGKVFLMREDTGVLLSSPPEEGTEARADWERRYEAATRGVVRIDFTRPPWV